MYIHYGTCNALIPYSDFGVSEPTHNIHRNVEVVKSASTIKEKPMRGIIGGFICN